MTNQSDNIAEAYTFSIRGLNAVANTNISDATDLEYIRENNRELSSKNTHLVKELGYSNFYDLSLSTLASEQERLMKGGNKDFSKLTAVEQTVVRNGKPTKMKVYVDKNKENEEGNELDSDTKGKQPMTASELNRGYSFGNLDTKVTPKKVKDLQNQIQGWESTKDFSSDSSDYLECYDEEGNLRLLVGVSKQGQFIVLDFMLTDGTISGYWITAFYELLKLGLDSKLGVKYPDLKTRALALLSEEYNLKLEGSYYTATYEDLVEAVGDV